MNIDKVNVTMQQGHRIYSFGAPALLLAKLCRVERFEDGCKGVNRQLNEQHVLEIAAAMSSREDTTLWLEPIIVALKGEWKYDEAQATLIGQADAYFSVDDGQHRVQAMKSNLLTEAELSKLNFSVTATNGLPYELRLRIFRMQAERRPIDARLDLAQRHHLNDWRNEKEREAYELILQLNSASSSPLKDRIQITESATRPRENRGNQSNLINARGLYRTIGTLFGRRSPICGLSPAKRAEIVTSTIRVASQVWSDAWNSERHILTTARGINAVLQLFVSGTNFRGLVGMDFTEANIRTGLEAARSYDWDANKHKLISADLITVGLDDRIRKTIQGPMTSRSRRNKASEMADKPVILS